MELGRNFLTKLQQLFVSKICRYNTINILYFLSLFEHTFETSRLTGMVINIFAASNFVTFIKLEAEYTMNLNKSIAD